LGREQLQLLRLALLVEDFNRFQPARLCATVQLAEIAQRGPSGVRTVSTSDQ